MRKGVGTEGRKVREDGIVGEENAAKAGSRQVGMSAGVRGCFQGVETQMASTNEFFHVVQRLDGLLDSLIQQPNTASIFSSVCSIVPRVICLQPVRQYIPLFDKREIDLSFPEISSWPLFIFHWLKLALGLPVSKPITDEGNEYYDWLTPVDLKF